MPLHHPFFGSALLDQLASEVGIGLLDVGSRGGLLADFLPVAAHTTGIGFEPDPTECDRLNEQSKTSALKWKEERHFPVALGESDESVTLNLCQQPGCSSTLQPNIPLLSEMGRADDFRIVSKLSMPVQRLDHFCEVTGILDSDFLKVDVQGGELAILKGGSKMVAQNLLGIRAEVEFTPLYLDQPQFSEMEMHLRSLGYYTADWIFQRHWRNDQSAEHGGYYFGKAIPYSRGRIIHSDVLFLRDHHWILENMQEPDVKLVRLAIIALLYHHIDLAKLILLTVSSPRIAAILQPYNLDKELGQVSRHLYRRMMKERTMELWKNIRRRVSIL